MGEQLAVKPDSAYSTLVNHRTASFQPFLETDLQGDQMSKHMFRAAYIMAIVLMCTAVVNANPPVRNDNLVPFFRDVRGPMCDPTDAAVGMITALTPLDTPLFNVRSPLPSCIPVLAPDGHPV